MTNGSDAAQPQAISRAGDNDENQNSNRSRMWSGFHNFHRSILDRYLFREFILAFFAVLAFCALLLLVASIFEKFQDILENNPPLKVVVMYFVCSLPFKLMQIVPMAAMLGVLFSIGTLARNNEILAMMTSGVASLRIAAPILFGGTLIAMGSLVMNEFVVPPLEQASRFYDQRLAGKDVSRIETNKDIFVRGKGSRFYLMRAFDTRSKIMLRPQIVDMNPTYSGLTKRIEAATAKFVREDEKNHRSEWQLYDSRVWDFDGHGNSIGFHAFPKQLNVYFEENLVQLVSQKKEPEEMNFFELHNYIRMLAERNQPVNTYRTDLIAKLTFPFGILIIMIIGFSYAVRTRAGTVMTAFGYGVFWAFLYYGFNALLRAMGHSGSVSPLMAGMIPIIGFFIVAIVMLRRSARWYA
jgi:lipopolysaccharide export system permease protein